MTEKKRILLGLAMLIFSAVWNVVDAQKQKADYYWLIDVSGKRNVYLDGIQHSIDTAYVVITEQDNLHVYNFAKTTATKDDLIDSDFYEYSDMGKMIITLDSLVSHAKSQFVRVFILSDFFNVDPTNGESRLNPELYAQQRKNIERVCEEKNVKFSLILLPPSSGIMGYSLAEIQNILPQKHTVKFPAAPDHSTTDFIMTEIEELNRQRGIIAEVTASESSLPTFIILGVFLAVLVGVSFYFGWKAYKQGIK